MAVTVVQVVLHFARGRQNTRAGRKLIKNPPLPFSADEAVHQMKKYQLSHEALEPCRRNVRRVSVDIQSHGLGHYSGSRVTSTNREGGGPTGKDKHSVVWLLLQVQVAGAF